MNKALLMSGLACASLIFGCQQKPVKEMQKPSFTEADMDLTFSPKSNFYFYANGGWMKNNPLPNDKSRFGAFDKLAEENRDKVKLVIETAAATNSPSGTINQQIGDFYASGMDTTAIETAGLAPINSYLEEIDAIQTREQLLQAIGKMQRLQLSPLFYFFAEGDNKNSNMMIANIYQGGLGMSDRDYYTDNGERAEKIRTAYSKYLTTLWSYLGNDSLVAKQKSDEILAFETKIAKASNSMLENRDPQKTYNKFTLAEMQTMNPDFNWPTLFKDMGIEAPAEINVNQPRFLKDVDQLIKNEPIEILKDYLTIHMIREVSPYLPKKFVDARFDFFGKVLSGQPQIEPRWKRVLNTTSGALGEGIGQLFVQKYFPAEAKQRMETLVENLRVAFAQRIKQLSWMSDSTKVRALEKLNAIGVKIGYPNKWRDYSGLEIRRDQYLANVLRSNEFDFVYITNKIGKPVDHEEWQMTPQTVNAYYHPVYNEIVFPAAILQPPFFYIDGDDAVNYGAIGVVIGHEMTHGFDDQGRQYDATGNLNDWWTAEDAVKFNDRTKLLVDQYNKIQITDSIHANGELTLGENIADLGGLLIAYQAYQNSLENKPKPADIDGFTDSQRFYLGYARIWAQNIRNEEMLRRVKEDVHSLGEHRVLTPLKNVQTFLQSFNVVDGDTMNLDPALRANIW